MVSYTSNLYIQQLKIHIYSDFGILKFIFTTTKLPFKLCARWIKYCKLCQNIRVIYFLCITKMSLSIPWRHRESGERAALIRNLGSSSRVGIFTPGETYPGLHSARWVDPINGLNASALVLHDEFNHDPSDLQPVPESLYQKHYTAFSMYSAYYYTCTNTLKDMSTSMCGWTCICNICRLLKVYCCAFQLIRKATLAIVIMNVELTMTAHDILHLMRWWFWWFTFQHI